MSLLKKVQNFLTNYCMFQSDPRCMVSTFELFKINYYLWCFVHIIGIFYSVLGFNEEILKFMIKNVADLEKTDIMGETPL